MKKGWLETSSTSWDLYNNSFDSVSEDSYSFSNDTLGTWVKFNITNSIKNIKGDKISNNGYMLITHCPHVLDTSKGNGGLWSYFASSDTSMNEVRPKLIVNYINETKILNSIQHKNKISLRIIESNLIINSEKSENVSIEIFSFSGKCFIKLNTVKLCKGLNNIAISKLLNSGIHLIKVKSKNRTIIQKISYN